MLFDFNLFETLRLNATSRWGIVQMNRQQSVAEHSFNVTSIVMHILAKKRTGQSVFADFGIVTYAICHDLSEVYSGDIPASEKGSFKEALDQWEEAMFPLHAKFTEQLTPAQKQIVKVADLMEAIIYARRHCIDVRKESIIAGLEKDLHMAIWEKFPDIHMHQRAELAKIVGELWVEEKTH